MAGSSKSSQTVKNVLIAILALWSIVSLIVIVVWATSPDLKGSAQCRAELQEATEKLEGTKVMFAKDKVALEEMVEEVREELDRQRAAVLVLVGRLNATNASLEECQQQKAVLNMNISSLQQQLELHQQTEANLTAQLALQEDHIENLEHNLTQAFHKADSCFSLKEAAQSQMMAAESQTKACQSSQQYLQKQLQKCKVTESEPSQQATKCSTTPSKNAASPLFGIPVLALLVFTGLHLITYR